MVKFIQEKKLIGKYFEEISQDSGRVCYGVEDTLKALELGAVEVLIVFENLEVNRWVLKDSNGTLYTPSHHEAVRGQQPRAVHGQGDRPGNGSRDSRIIPRVDC